MKHKFSRIGLIAIALWILPRCAFGVVTPAITSISNPVFVGESFTINGDGFTKGSVVNFFVATGGGAINAGPLTPSFDSTTVLMVPVPATVSLGEGFVTVEVVNTDQGSTVSNQTSALLQGSASAGIPTLKSIDGVSLAATSSDPSVGVNNVETVITPGKPVTLGGTGFDATHGVAINIFCACPPLNNAGPVFVGPGAGLTSTSLTFTLPAGVPTGPASLAVVNKGSDGKYSKSSNAVSVVVGATISVTSVTQGLAVITVNGTGFSTETVINFYNSTSGGVVNLGGTGPSGPSIPLTLINPNQFTFTKPALAMPGPSYVQALNPPFVPFTSSGTGPGGAFILTGPFLTGECVGPESPAACFPFSCCKYRSKDTTSCPIGEQAIAPNLICSGDVILRIDSARRCMGIDPYDRFGLVPEYCEAQF
jgi:hypothetical protein